MKNASLEARGALAMSRVVAGLNPEASKGYLELAQFLAMDEGTSGRAVTAYIAGEPQLLGWFLAGQHEYDFHQAQMALYPDLAWSGGWHPSCGLYETKAVVANGDDGFAPGLLVSYMGGEYAPSFGPAVETLAEAIGAAEELQARWGDEKVADQNGTAENLCQSGDSGSPCFESESPSP